MKSDKLKEARALRGMSMQAMADALGISFNTYQKYEYSSREPSYDTLSKMADILGVTTDYLLGREPKSPDSPIDAFAKNVNLKELEKILIERYLKLPDKQREAVLEFMRDAISEEAKRKAAMTEDESNSHFGGAPAPEDL